MFFKKSTLKILFSLRISTNAVVISILSTSGTFRRHRRSVPLDECPDLTCNCSDIFFLTVYPDRGSSSIYIEETKTLPKNSHLSKECPTYRDIANYCYFAFVNFFLKYL